MHKIAPTHFKKTHPLEILLWVQHKIKSIFSLTSVTLLTPHKKALSHASWFQCQAAECTNLPTAISRYPGHIVWWMNDDWSEWSIYSALLLAATTNKMSDWTQASSCKFWSVGAPCYYYTRCTKKTARCISTILKDSVHAEMSSEHSTQPSNSGWD